MQVLLSPLQDHLGVSAALATGRVECGNSKVEAKEAKQNNQILPKSLFDGHATSLSGGGGGGLRQSQHVRGGMRRAKSSSRKSSSARLTGCTVVCLLLD